jgi:hypothetical protein
VETVADEHYMLTLIPCSKRGGLGIEKTGDLKEGVWDLISLLQ